MSGLVSGGQPLLAVSRLTKVYVRETGLLRRRGGEVRAVDGVSLLVARGETLALVGESGCGKTTTGLCIVRSEEPTGGEVLYTAQPGARARDVLKLAADELRGVRREIRMVFQDPFASLNARMTALRIVGEPLINNGLARSAAALQERVAEMLRLVQLDPIYMNRYPHSFSGGQRQRLAFARAFILQPKLVIADEPVSALDVSVQAQILNLMKRLQAQRATSYLFIAHNLAVVRYLSERVAIMYLGRIVELASRREVFSRPRHPYTELLLAASPNPDPTARKLHLVRAGEVPSSGARPSGCPFHPRCPYREPRCAAEAPELEESGAGGGESHLVACHLHRRLTLRAPGAG